MHLDSRRNPLDHLVTEAPALRAAAYARLAREKRDGPGVKEMALLARRRLEPARILQHPRRGD